MKEFTFNMPIRGMLCAVAGNYYAASRGARDSLGGIRGAGPALEPDEDAEFEVVSVTDLEQDKEVIQELTEEELAAVAAQGLNECEEQVERYYDDYPPNEPDYDEVPF